MKKNIVGVCFLFTVLLTNAQCEVKSLYAINVIENVAVEADEALISIRY